MTYSTGNYYVCYSAWTWAALTQHIDIPYVDDMYEVSFVNG